MTTPRQLKAQTAHDAMVRPTAKDTAYVKGNAQSPTVRLSNIASARLAKLGTYGNEIGQDLDHLKTVAERLDTLKKPVTEVIGRLKGAAVHMALNSNNFRVQMQAKMRHAEQAIEYAQNVVIAGQQRAGAPEEQAKRASIVRDVEIETIKKVADKLLSGQQVATHVESTITSLKVLEDAVARERLRSLGVGGNTADLSLEQLLKDQAILLDLEQRPMGELYRYYHDVSRVDPTEARRLEGPLFQLARKRADVVETRRKARQVAKPYRTDEDRILALRLVGEIEASREARQAPELIIYEGEVKPLIVALVRKLLAVDVKELSRSDFERFSKSWRIGARLDEQPIAYGWPLRGAFSALDANVRRQLPAKFFAPLGVK